jgi:hypothetical protein
MPAAFRIAITSAVLTIDAAAGNPERLPAGERVPRAVRDH